MGKIDGYCYFNGQMVLLDEAKARITDRGLMYGDGIFETIRVYNGKPYLLERHLNRLFEGARTLAINVPATRKQFRNAIKKVIESNHLAEGYLRLTLSRGETGRGLWGAEISQSRGSIAITAGKAIAYTALQYKEGFRAVLVSFPRNHLSPVAKLKTLNFLENILGKREAFFKNCDEGIFLNTEQCLMEGTTSNLFLVVRGELITPPLSAGILPGITRAVVIALSGRAGLSVREENMAYEAFADAEEAFLTSSLMEIMPLVQVDGSPVGKGLPGPVTERVAGLYKEKINKLTK